MYIIEVNNTKNGYKTLHKLEDSTYILDFNIFLYFV